MLKVIKYCIKRHFETYFATLYQGSYMPTKKHAAKRLISAFAQQKCWTIASLAKQINYSIPSVRRLLTKVGYYSSITHNGRWYTLASIPHFGHDGLWFYQDIGFSCAGSLNKALVRLVERSPSGMTAEQLGKILKCRCHAVLVKLYRKKQLQRQKYGRSYIYLSSDAQTANMQCRAIQASYVNQLPAEIEVLLLAEFIRIPDAGSRQLAKAVSQRTGIKIKDEQVQTLFKQYGLQKNCINCGAKALTALAQCLEKLKQEILPGKLFPQPPVIRFRHDRDVCQCTTPLVVQKTRRKNVQSMTGPFIAHETLLCCPQCERVYTSETLRQLVANRCNVAWDVVVFVGQSLFRHHRITEHIRRDLQALNINLCPSEIEYLGRKFIMYLALAHRQAVPRIKQAMQQSGGYILHLDATHELDAPALMTGMDGLSKFVLANVKIPTEHSNHIVPFLQQLKRDFGVPIACVHDMGTGICKAVTQVFPDSKDFVCHFHFLRDIGKDLLNPAYTQLRNILRSHAATKHLSAMARQARQQIHMNNIDFSPLISAIKDEQTIGDMQQSPLISTYLLILWCLQGKKSGNGFGFPFDRPLLQFARHMITLSDCLPALQSCFNRVADKDRTGDKIFSKFMDKVQDIVQDSSFLQAIEELQWRCLLFDDLRKKMRITEPGRGNGLNDDGTHKAMSSIRNGVRKFRTRLDKDQKLVKDMLCRKVAKQIDKYNEKLFADPVEVNTPLGSMKVYPQRTNNMLEQFFRGLRRGYRYKTGNNSMRKTLQAMLADTPLIKNLDNPVYLEILLNGNNSLEELFAKLERNSCIKPLESNQNIDNILPEFKPLINIQNLPDRLIQIVEDGHAVNKSN